MDPLSLSSKVESFTLLRILKNQYAQTQARAIFPTAATFRV